MFEKFERNSINVMIIFFPIKCNHKLINNPKLIIVKKKKEGTLYIHSK